VQKDAQVSDSPGQPIGSWTVSEVLGRGGNATVWKASRAGDTGDTTPVALKVLNVTKTGHESYKRFTREIGFLQAHQDVPGLLPLLDAHLPEQPSKADRAWLAMPLATPIAESLSSEPLTTVVAAVAAIADALARLQAGYDIAHRDIKPGNLYELNGSWLIGDFGLIALPDAESLTTDGRQVGPAHYTAYEMILNPMTAQPHPADVYSLGKTLWVLATGQAWPPEGHQPVGMRGFGIGDFRPHPRSGVLDQEVDLMTRVHPEERPSKEQVARDLAAWQDLAAQPVVFDLSEARARLREKLRVEIAEQDQEEQRKDLAYEAVRHLQELTAPLNAELKGLHPRTDVDSMTDDLTRNTVGSLSHQVGRRIVFRWQRCTIVAPDDRAISTTLRMSRSLELRDDGLILLHLLVLVAPYKTMGNYFAWQSGERSAQVGGAEAEKMLEDAVRDLTEALTQAVNVFIEHVPGAADDS
jgi:serine/threonine protein kinase